MYTVLLFLLTILQWIALIIVIGAFGLLVVAGLYFVSSDFRHLCQDFANWVDRREFRKKRNIGEPSEEYQKYLEDADKLLMQVHGLPKRYASLFEEVAEEYGMEPKYTIADAKAQDAADADIVDKSTEFRKDFE